MTTIVIGLFPTQKDAKQLATDLENNGFVNEDYIVYLNKKEKEQKENFWNKLFGNRTPQFNTEELDKLIASVSIKSGAQLTIAKEIFTAHHAVHTYEFDDVSIIDAQSLDYLKAKVAVRAKVEVYASMAKNKTNARKMHADLSQEAFA